MSGPLFLNSQGECALVRILLLRAASVVLEQEERARDSQNICLSVNSRPGRTGSPLKPFSSRYSSVKILDFSVTL